MEKQLTPTNYEVIPIQEATHVRFYTSIHPGSYVPPHWHDAVEIVYLQKGDLTFEIEDHVIKMEVGQCVLVNPNVIHATYGISPNQAIVFQIPTSLFELCCPDIRQFICTFNDPDSDPQRQEKVNAIKKMMEEMQALNDTKPDGSVLRFNSLLFEIMYQLRSFFAVQVFRAKLGKRSQELSRLLPVLSYTEKNYNQHIPLERVAKIANLQEQYFCRFFKKLMGVTYLQYQNEVKLSHIYRDIISTDDQISVILEHHGFTNYGLFRKMFQNRFNNTPSNIRKLYREDKFF